MSCHFVKYGKMGSSTTRVFAVETYFNNNDYLVAAQHIFRRHFNLGRHGRVPDVRTIIRWANSFRLTASSSIKERLLFSVPAGTKGVGSL